MCSIEPEIVVKTALRALAVTAAFIVSTSVTAQTHSLLLFGGPNHDVYLGCFNCPPYESESICNEFGRGNELGNTLFNDLGRFGNSLMTDSPWNDLSTSSSVPVLVSETGEFYGYFTVNDLRHDAVGFASELRAMFQAAGGNLVVVRNMICRALHGD